MRSKVTKAVRAPIGAAALCLTAALLAPVGAGAYERPADPLKRPEWAAGEDPGSPQQPAPPPALYSRYRASWYLGFGVGGGPGGVSDGRGFDLSTSGGLALTLRIGWVGQPWLLLGFEGSVWSTPRGGEWRQTYHTGAVLTLFPLREAGLYGRFGLGGGLAVLRDERTSELQADVGLDLKAGLGYELQIGDRLNLGLDLTFARTAYSGGAAQDLCAGLTFVWY